MKTIQEILNASRSAEDIMSDLKVYNKDSEPWANLEKLFDPKKHPIIADPSLRPKDKMKNGRREVAARISYGAEKIVARRMTQMAFSIPVKRTYNYGDDAELRAFADAIEAVYRSVRINGVNAKRMYSYFSSCETSTFWWVQVSDQEHSQYGFPTTGKVRCRSFSPMPKKFSGISQASIWPLFDDDEDLIALSAEYSEIVLGKTVHYFDCYTAALVTRFRQEDGVWSRVDSPNLLGKIPAVYIERPLPVYDGISDFRNDIEFTLSRNSDNIRKNAHPIVKVSGDIVGDAPTGDTSREVYRLAEGGDVQMISPALTTTDSTNHVASLKSLIEETTQLPDLSLENVRSLGAVSGEARRTIMADAHLKVGQEAHDILWFFDREFSIVKSIVCSLNPHWEQYKDVLTCTHEITPYIMEDRAAEIDQYVKASGGPILSQKSAIEKSKIVDDVNEEISRLEEEREAANKNSMMTDLFGGAS